MNSHNPVCQVSVPLLRTKLYPVHAEGALLLEPLQVLLPMPIAF